MAKNYGKGKTIVISGENIRHPERFAEYVKKHLALEKEHNKQNNLEAKKEREFI